MSGGRRLSRKRVVEYEKMCHSSGLGIYTDSPKISPTTLLSLSRGMRISERVHAILRDSYNHVSAILFRQETGGIIMVPVIDDGTVYPTVKMEVDWRNFMKGLATANVAKEFYATKLAAVLKDEPAQIVATYVIDGVWRLDKSVPSGFGREDMYGLHLASGIVVPCKKPESGETHLESEFLQEGQESNWTIDTKLVFGKKDATTMEINFKEFKEIYQHLRFTFANWVAIQPAPLRKQMNDVLYGDYPLYEKRQRLFIKLGNEVMSWLDSSIPMRGRTPSLKRVDCRVMKDKDSCTNHCVWRDETSKCLLHVPNEPADVKGLMVKRLIEELIRFPRKREELLANKVNKYTTLTRGFLSGDQYIVPEDSVDWFELLRFEWRKVYAEEPKYLEEFSSVQPIEEPAFTKAEMPEILEKYILAKDVGKYGYFETESAAKVLVALSGARLSMQELVSRGQQLDAPILVTQELVDFVADRLGLSVIQLVYEADAPFEPAMLFRTIMLQEVRAPICLLCRMIRAVWVSCRCQRIRFSRFLMEACRCDQK
jgi:hypothetical protein